MRFSQKLLAIATALAVGASASMTSAQMTITGAVATFPIHAKWASEYKKSTGTRLRRGVVTNHAVAINSAQRRSRCCYKTPRLHQSNLARAFLRWWPR